MTRKRLSSGILLWVLLSALCHGTFQFSLLAERSHRLLRPVTQSLSSLLHLHHTAISSSVSLLSNSSHRVSSKCFLVMTTLAHGSPPTLAQTRSLSLAPRSQARRSWSLVLRH